MGTRSVVAVRESNSVEITSAYVHYDGYLSGVGMTLLSAFNSAEGAREVVEGGYYSSLSENLEESLSGSANKEEASVYENMEEFKHWSEFEAMSDDVLKDVLETASRLEGSKWNGEYDDYVVELREWATGFIAESAVN